MNVKITLKKLNLFISIDINLNLIILVWFSTFFLFQMRDNHFCFLTVRPRIHGPY